MELKFFSYPLSMLFTTTLAAQSAQPEWKNLTTVALRIPYGQSVSTFPLTVPRRITPLRIVYGPTPGCSQFSVYPRVRYQGNKTWSELRFQNKLFLTANKNVELIEINFIQNVYQWQDCQISLQSLAPDHPRPPRRVLAGLSEHAGGFVNRKRVPLQASYYTQDIELVIPADCPDYEVADLGVVTEGGTSFVSPEGNRPRTLSYHLPQPMNVSLLELSLLAPASQSCQIPVYVWPLTSES